MGKGSKGIDRCIFSNQVFLKHNVSYIQDVNMDIVSARDNRYDAVFHLVTCADGAPDYYTLSNNDARSEDLDKAIDVS